MEEEGGGGGGEGSSRKEEVEEKETESTFLSVYHNPCCYLLQQVLNHIFKCLGFDEIIVGTNGKQDTRGEEDHHNSPEDEQVVEEQEDTATIHAQKCSEEEVPTAEEDAENINQNFEVRISSVMLRRGRPRLSNGSGGQIN